MEAAAFHSRKGCMRLLHAFDTRAFRNLGQNFSGGILGRDAQSRSPRGTCTLRWNDEPELPYGVCMATQVSAHITGTVWKIEVKVGDQVDEGQTCVILESMKMEMPVEAPNSGKVEKINCSEGQAVNEGDVLLELT
jgi:acetyl-CoA carboxylase biotin carboxyl carrier protein